MQADLTPQQSKALDFEHSISLRANAGSGKTFVLAKRYLQIAIAGNVPLQKIAAITFTDKAAGELYKRIAEEIETEIGLSADNYTRRKIENIRRQLVSANISTIHSFCINILKEFPVDAQLDANFTPIDQNRSSELLELSIEETIRKKLEDSTNTEIKHLIRLFGSKINLVKQLRILISNRKIVLKLKEDIYKKNVENISNHFRESSKRYFQLIFSPLIKNLINDIETINNVVIQNEPGNDIAVSVAKILNSLVESNNIENTIKIIHQLSDTICIKSGKIKKTKYLAGTYRDGIEREIENIEEAIQIINKIEFHENTNLLEKQLALSGKYLVNIFDVTLYLYNQKKQEQGYLDYEDILLNTKKLLQSESVSDFLSKKFKYLMVDEYQDTNEIQYEIFMPILDYLRKGNLFIVGDEKQSIYRFREAELEIFDRTNSDIIDKSGNDYLLTLPDSFRMEPEICLFTNVLFKNLFEQPDKIFNEVNHSDLICAKPEETGGKVSILITEKESDVSEAELVSKQIIKLLSEEKENLDWKDIAILVRKRSSFKDLEKQFVKYNIPYRIIGGRGFFQRQSIYDIFNYFSFLLDPNNDAALVGILRSPFFSFSDVKLYEISLNNGKSFWDKMQSSNVKDKKLSEAISLLKHNLVNVGKQDVNTLLNEILQSTNCIAVLASRPDGDQELANIEKLRRLTNSFTNQGFKTLYDYVNFLQNSITNLDDEAQAGLASQANAVNILTLHQAKGLEFPVVFLYKCNDVSKHDTVKSKSVTVDKNFGLLTKTPLNEDYFDDYKSIPLVAIRDYIEIKKELAETKRLFYVGVTRSKKYLYLSTTAKANDKYDPSSFMGMLIKGLNINLDSSEVMIKGKLEYLIKKNNKYENETKLKEIIIPIIRNVELLDKRISDEKKLPSSHEFLLKKVSDKSKGEIISATKVATYSQCPLKYKLIYKIGYSELYNDFNLFKNKVRSNAEISSELSSEDIRGDDNYEHNVLKRSANIKGQIIHKALQKEIQLENLEQFINNEIMQSYPNHFNLKKEVTLFTGNVLNMLKNFYQSNEYKYISTFRKYKNEMEIYLNESDYYLYGIIDKLIINDDKIIIVDYKTDEIELKSIEDRAKYYLNQQNFYANIVSKLYKDFSEIEIRLLFLMYPDNPFIKKYYRKNISEIGESITKQISGILSEEYSKNFSHCYECNFSSNKKCIV